MSDLAGAPTHQRIEELERTLASLREDSEVAYVLLGLSGALGEVRSSDETLALAVRTIPELFGASRCFAATWDETKHRFNVQAHSGYGDGSADHLVKTSAQDAAASATLARSLSERSPIFVSDEDPVAGKAMIVIPLVRWGESFGALRLDFDAPRSFGAKDAALARGVARQIGVALNNARRFRLLQELRTFGLAVGARLRLPEVMDQVVSGAVTLLSAEAAWLYFVDASHEALVTGRTSGTDLALPERFARLPLDEEPWSSIPDNDTLLIPGLGAEFGAERDLVAVVASLCSGSDPFMGALIVVMDASRTPGAEELEALSVLAGQSAQAIDNARHYDRQRSVARTLQNGLLRTDVPEMLGCDLGAIYEPASGEADVGGDFYDVIDLSEGRFGLVVGDVSGKGAEAAAQTAMVKYTLRALAARNPAPGSVLFHLNNALVRDLAEDRFVTITYGLFDTKTRSCALAIAGHPPPFIYRASTGEVEMVEATGGIIGAFADQNFEPETVQIELGDIFVAYTDGLIEARSGDELFGVARVRQTVGTNAAAGKASEIARSIYEEAQRFGTVTDDTVVFVLTCAGDAG